MGKARLGRVWVWGLHGLCRQPALCGLSKSIRPAASPPSGTAVHRTKGPGHCCPRALPSVVTVTQTPQTNFPWLRALGSPFLPHHQLKDYIQWGQRHGQYIQGLMETQKLLSKKDPGERVRYLQSSREGGLREHLCP